MGLYLEYIRISFQTLLAYRLRYVVGIVTYLIHVGVYYFIYKALFAQNSSINGYSLSQMVTYVSIGWISKSFYLNYIDHNIAADVREGKLAVDLVKPQDFQCMYYARGAGQCLFRMLFFTPPIVVAAVFIFPVNGPAGAAGSAGFAVSTLLSVLIYLGMNYLMGMAAIYFLSIHGILHLKNTIVELLSGLLVPIDWFPVWFRTISRFLPFKMVAYVPLSIYLGRISGPEIYVALLRQAIWVVVLFVSGRLLWRFCQRKIMIQGG